MQQEHSHNDDAPSAPLPPHHKFQWTLKVIQVILLGCRTRRKNIQKILRLGKKQKEKRSP